IYFNISFLVLNPNSFHFLYPGTIIFTLAYAMALLYFFPVFVHFKLSFFQYIKQPFFLALISPLEVIAILLVVVMLFAFIVCIPGMIALCSESVLCICFLYLSRRSFRRLTQKRGENQ